MEKTRYLVSDDKKIIDYILEMELEWEVKGNQMWKQMQQDMENCRTWQSLKNRYLKYIVPALHLSEYGLDDAGIKRLKDGAKVNSSTKKQANRYGSFFSSELLTKIVHNRSVDNSPDRHFYTLEEDKEILEALLKTSLKHLKGNEIWQKMVKDGVCEGRTYESMRNRFLKNIVPDLTKLVYKY